MVASPAVFQARSALWTPGIGAWVYVGDPDANVFPIGLTNDGVILGQARNSKGDPVAVVCMPGGNWERLGTADAWVPVAINNGGDVVGWARIDGIMRPWLRPSSGGIVLLPHVIEHQTFPSAIDDAGHVVGSATADHGMHAVIWQC